MAKDYSNYYGTYREPTFQVMIPGKGLVTFKTFAEAQAARKKLESVALKSPVSANLNSKGNPKYTNFEAPAATTQQGKMVGFTATMGGNNNIKGSKPTNEQKARKWYEQYGKRNPNWPIPREYASYVNAWRDAERTAGVDNLGRPKSGTNGGLIGSYENAYGEAKNANEDRWLALLDQYNKFREDATKREGLNLDLLKTQKKQNMKDLNQGYKNLGSQNDQRMVNSGLYNSTIATTLAAGNEKQRAAAMNRLYDDYTAQELGVRNQYNSTVNGIDKDYIDFLERRDDPYPDLNRYTQLAGAMGSTGAGGSGSSGGYGAYDSYGGMNRYGAGGGGVASPGAIRGTQGGWRAVENVDTGMKDAQGNPVMSTGRQYSMGPERPEQYNYIEMLRKQKQADQEAAFYAKNPIPEQNIQRPYKPTPGMPVLRRKPTVMRY